MHLAAGPHLVGMSAASWLDFASPTVYRDVRLWSPASPSGSSCAPRLPCLPLYLLLGLQLSTPSPKSHPQDVVDHGLASLV